MKKSRMLPLCRGLAFLSGSTFLVILCAAATGHAEPESKPLRHALAPSAPLQHPRSELHFVADPATDGVLLGTSLGFDVLSGLVMSSGELTPQKPARDDKLLSIDRVAVTQTVDPHAAGYSSIGVGVGIAYALGDTVATGFTRGGKAALVDGILYGETASLTLAVTNLVKIAVRRPRPSAYRERDRLAALGQPYPDNAGTDSSLSFFSGHTATVAALSATATYLAFSHSATRGWITLIAGSALTSFVAYERVRAAAHFPTDVLAGAVVGGGIGTLVPLLHRQTDVKQPPIWVSVIRPGDDSAGLALTGLF